MLRGRTAVIALLSASTVLALASGTAQAALPAAGTRQSADPHIVALGDSYMAGIGAGDYWERDGCRRSVNSPAALWASDVAGALTDLSCPGAKVADVAQRLPLVPSGADIVLVQVGGNDVGFGTIAGACIIGGTSSCVAAAQRAIAQARRLPTSLAALLSRTQGEAPGARVIALGYPSLVGMPAQCASSPAGSVISAESVLALRRVQRSLDAAVRAAARSAGTAYLDWPLDVNAHSLCSPDPWYVLPGTGRLDDLLHPTVEATRSMAAHLDARAPR
ncbi:MAG: SGNH/GDSL hydrolase family protein [bacterium]